MRSLHALALGAAALALATPLQAQGQRYDFRLTGEGEDARGRVTWLGDRGRVDVEHTPGDHRGDEYFLLRNGGRTLISVHPEDRSYSVVDDTVFERVVGRALEAVDGMVDFTVDGVRIAGERLGPGGTIAGHATERYRLTQEFTVRIGVPFVEDPEIRQTVVTEYWVAPEVKLIRNPVLEMLATVETALAQGDTSFVRRSRAARASLFRGTPLKFVIRSTSEERDGDETDIDTDVRTIEITGIGPADIDPASLEIPAGYRRDDEVRWRPGKRRPI